MKLESEVLGTEKKEKMTEIFLLSGTHLIVAR